MLITPDLLKKRFIAYKLLVIRGFQAVSLAGILIFGQFIVIRKKLRKRGGRPYVICTIPA